jgi:hypothetical protein
MTAPQSWSRRLFSLPVVLAAALTATLFLFATTRHNGNTILTDPDIWWHLSNARELLTTGHFIRSDIHTFTVGGKPWINFEWLAELPYYFAYRWLGDRGLFLVMMLVSEAIVLGVFRLAYIRSRNVLASFLASWLAVLMMTVSLWPRTLLFGWLLLIVELLILWTYRKGRRTIWFLPPLFLLWINTHGSWFIGFVLLLVFMVSRYVGGRWGDIESTRWSPAERTQWWLVGCLSFALLYINPYGWRLVEYPLDVAFHQSLTLKFIAEWATLDFHAARGKLVLATLFGLALLNLLRRRTWQLSDLLFAVIAIYGAFTYSRFVFLFGILICPMLAIDLHGALASRESKPGGTLFNVVGIAALLAMVALRWPSQAVLHEGIRTTYPEQALARINQLPPNTRLLNSFEWGGYLMWNAPAQPLFIDGRTDIFVHQGIMQDYADALAGQRVSEVLQKYDLNAVFIPRSGPLVDQLTHDPRWKRTYEDSNSVLFEQIATHQ